ncbi:class I SAM-dependent RNA methyltransferase [Formicincola oecophyllae]|uniref:Class I SAM-dependent RNA methyltransferase n=1 Tax=Formicincola oecophyllae TaxID=2558361 RepID=A0A4Y6U7I1_9PROT|nr:class I SAM-dependent RNA methyltransferase [Formicincola oecophyllae]QDH12970.1 class I SAM-dependent RNA methyltransferase [Formicincola oecophyllae]
MTTATTTHAIAAPCPHFGRCGGCALQDRPLAANLEQKCGRVEGALRQAGFENLPQPGTFQVQPHSRRRMDLAVERVQGGVLLGLHARRGNPIDVADDCLLPRPEIAALFNPLEEVLATLGALTKQGGVAINLLDSGPDITLELATEPSAPDRAKLADFAVQHDIARISWRPAPHKAVETLVLRRPVFHSFGPLKVSPPAAAFMQATVEAEKALADAVLVGLPKLNRKDRIFELYAGCGTLTGPLSEVGQVVAMEGHGPAEAALRSATKGLRITTQQRDLVRQPLQKNDLDKARVVVLDPPRAGAGPQMQPLAASSVQDVVYVSCSPESMAKDLAVLRRAGFAVLQWTVVDQFLWSPEVETVVVLTRDPKRLKKAAKQSEPIAPT